MFKQARKELHRVLSKHVFAMVSKGVTVPADCVIDGVVTHYYTSAEELPVVSTRKGGMVWVKKKARTFHPEKLGPIELNCGREDVLPKVGDILMGELAKVESSRQQFGRQKFVAERQSYKWWAPNAAPVYYLAVMVLKGTSETEASLRSILKLDDNYDDLWMLARIVLFNNIRCVADLLLGQGSDNVKLQMGPVQFVQQLSLFLKDLTLMTEFQKLVPDIEPTVVVKERVAPPMPSSAAKFVGRKRRAVESSDMEEYDPSRPSYFDFSHRQPAGETAMPGSLFSGAQSTYTPRSPQGPRSPPYAPQTPPHLSGPQSPPYVPCSPPYVPCSPPYAPCSPPYKPESPSVHSTRERPPFPPMCQL